MNVTVSDGVSDVVFNIFDHVLHYLSVESASTSVIICC
jgi:hypothetical protein